jgi:hypothetical protein
LNPLDGLLQSYLDLQRHFDPAAASAAGFVSADARLGGFDAQTMREHLVAFRAIAAAIEDVELDELEDEIDRTALLAEVRGSIARLEQERPHARDPGFWIGHARQAVASLMSRPMPDAVAPAALARISALPGFFDAARGTLRRPPVLLVDAALLELGPLGELLVRAAALFGPAAPGGTEAMNAGVTAALEALKRFGTALRDEIEPEADWARGALGLELFERRLQEAYAIRSSAAELTRWAEHTLDEIGSAVAGGAMQPTSGVPTPIDPLVEAQEEAMKNLPSAVRRTLRSAVAVEGWSLYASGAGREHDPRWLARLRRAAARLAVDVGLHARGMTPAAATELLIGSGAVAAATAAHELRSIAAAPTSGLAEAAGYREIARLRDAFASREGDDRNVFHAALLRYGALPPGLAGWGMGLEG